MEETEVFLNAQVKNLETPSVQYLIFNRENIIDHYSKGLARIENHILADATTTYNAFSVTKTFTALAIVQLAEHKIFNLDDMVKNLMPDFPYSPEITIKQLLSHAGGIPNPIPLSWIHLPEEHEGFDRNQFFRTIFAKNEKQRSQPGERFAYSNLGYVLLGQLIERVSGLTYEEYISRNIISKLGLLPGDLGFRITDATKHARGYHRIMSLSYFVLGFLIDRKKYFDKTEGPWKSFRNYYVNGVAYGGLIGTPKAFVKYLQELMKPEGKLLSEEYKKLLFTQTYTEKNERTRMCLSWFKGRLNGRKYFSHAGGGGGYYSEIRIYPDEGIGSVIFYNRTGMKDERMLDKVDRYYFNQLRPATK